MRAQSRGLRGEAEASELRSEFSETELPGLAGRLCSELWDGNSGPRAQRACIMVAEGSGLRTRGSCGDPGGTSLQGLGGEAMLMVTLLGKVSDSLQIVDQLVRQLLIK